MGHSDRQDVSGIDEPLADAPERVRNRLHCCPVLGRIVDATVAKSRLVGGAEAHSGCTDRIAAFDLMFKGLVRQHAEWGVGETLVRNTAGSDPYEASRIMYTL